MPYPAVRPDAHPAHPDAPSAAVTALVPLRTGGKSRLGAALDAPSRAGLVLAMLDDVLAALHAAGVLDVRVLASGDEALAAAHARGLPAVPDPPSSGDGAAGDALLRRAVDAGLAAVPSDRDRLVVAGDLPLLSAAEVTMVLDVASDVVVVPTSGGGTALLRLAPGVDLGPQQGTRYGPGSAEAHVKLARRAGRTVTLLELPGAHHDVDSAADLAALHRLLAAGLAGPAGPGRASAAFLAEARG